MSSGAGTSRLPTSLIVMLVRIYCYLAYPRQMLNFRRKVGYWPDSALPGTSNEKYTWRKVFDRNPLFTEASDKLLAKQLAQRLCPQIRVPETLWTGNRAEDIPDELLRGSVVVKTNHSSGWNYFVHEGKHDREELNRQVNGWLGRRYGRRHAEWGYYGVEARLFVEEMLLEPDGQPLVNEYKSYIGRDGQIALTFCRQADDTGKRIDAVIDCKGRVASGHSETNVLSDKAVVPDEYDEICRVSRVLSEPFDFVRCDLYVHAGELYFSEFTLYSYGGYATMDNSAIMQRLADVWDIRTSWFMTTPQTGWRRAYANCLRQRLAGTQDNPRVDAASQTRPFTGGRGIDNKTSGCQ